MKINLMISLLALVCCCLSAVTSAATDEELVYPEIGIMSSDLSDAIAVFMVLIHSNWKAALNNYDDNCKRYTENISMTELKKIMIFDYENIILMTPETQVSYGSSSPYFESCNYIGLKYIHWWYFWDNEENKLLEWGDSDAYIDAEHVLLLIKFLDGDGDIPLDQRQVSALFVYKEYQMASNWKTNRGFLKNAINSKGFGQLIESFF